MIDEKDLKPLDGLRRLDEQWVQQKFPHERRRNHDAASDRNHDANGGRSSDWNDVSERSHDSDHRRERRDSAPEWSTPVQLIASVVAPGSAAFRRHPFVAAGLFIPGFVVPAVFLAIAIMNRDRIIGLALDPTVLLFVASVAGLVILTRLLAVVEVVYSNRYSEGVTLQAVLAGAVVVGLAFPVLGFAARATDARSTLAGVFVAQSGDPLFVPTATASTIDPAAVKNILIFGGDAGPGRWGMRTDTMMLVSVHEESGRTALTSIPRNLTQLQFPPGTPLAAQFPNGFDDLANALFTHVNTDAALTDAYGTSGLQPEAIALVEALGHSLDVEIDDFALVNMQGFAEVIDAVGGVTLELGQTVPLPPTLVGERQLPTEIGPGFVEMDGALAIAYARSREADSDYQRMARQRQLLAALGSQVSTAEALGAFSTVTGVLDDSMRTSLSAGEFDSLLDRLGDNSAIMESVGLAPPLITPGSPDWAVIRSVVEAVQRAVVTGQASGYGT